MSLFGLKLGTQPLAGVNVLLAGVPSCSVQTQTFSGTSTRPSLSYDSDKKDVENDSPLREFFLQLCTLPSRPNLGLTYGYGRVPKLALYRDTTFCLIVS
jgi:hypothetical protein